MVQVARRSTRTQNNIASEKLLQMPFALQNECKVSPELPSKATALLSSGEHKKVREGKART